LSQSETSRIGGPLPFCSETHKPKLINSDQEVVAAFHPAGMTGSGHVWTAPWQELSDVAAALVGCGHVSGLLMRHGWPLALMLCADRVPIVHMHSEVR
jgi:hypothetical protein